MRESSDRELLRKNFKPNRVSLLFVGESPPESDTFFYQENSFLHRYTRDAFIEAGLYTNNPEQPFVCRFQDLGCYLVDLCDSPLNHLPMGERKRARKDGVNPLAGVIKTLNPQAIISTPRAIEQQVKCAINMAQAHLYHRSLPFPAMSHQKRYTSELSDVLNQFFRGTV